MGRGHGRRQSTRGHAASPAGHAPPPVRVERRAGTRARAAAAGAPRATRAPRGDARPRGRLPLAPEATSLHAGRAGPPTSDRWPRSRQALHPGPLAAAALHAQHQGCTPPSATPGAALGVGEPAPTQPRQAAGPTTARALRATAARGRRVARAARRARVSRRACRPAGWRCLLQFSLSSLCSVSNG